MADVERDRVTALWREAANTFAVEDDPFTDDALLRLAASSQDYYQSHGHYVPPLALRLHAARAECGRLREQLDAARQALERYGSHDARCASYQHDFRVRFRDTEPTCLCGYEARAKAVCAALGVEGEQEKTL